MATTRINKDDYASIKNGYMQKIEDLAMELFNETGIRMKRITLDWTQTDVPEEHLMNDRAEPEFDIEVAVCDSQFI